MRRCWCGVAATVAGAVAGCWSTAGDLAYAAKPAPWHARKPMESLPAAPNTVTVQQMRLDRPGDDPLLHDRLWRVADDRFLDPETKAELARQGLRVAKLADPPPQELLDLLDDGAPGGTSNRMLAGSPFKVELTPVLAERALFRVAHGALTGETVRNAQGYCTLTPQLAPGDRVRMVAEPLLEFGDALPQPVVGAPLHALEWKYQRAAREFPELRVEAELAPGECLLIGPVPNAGNTIGGLLFRKEKGGETLLGTLLVRAARPAPDELFRAGHRDATFGGGAERLRTPAGAVDGGG